MAARIKDVQCRRHCCCIAKTGLNSTPPLQVSERDCFLFTLFHIAMRNVLFCSVVFLLFLVGCSSDEVTKENLTQIMRSGSRSMLSEAQSDTYVIRQGDQIQISVWGYPEFNTDATVKEGGKLNIPLIGEMVVVGFTRQQFIADLKKRLEEYIQGEVKLNVTISSAFAQKISVLGEVSKQENYPFTEEATLLEVLSSAGGTTADSDLRHIKIYRRGASREPLEVDLAWYLENGDIESIPLVRPGDTVFIPKKGNIIRELSDFMRDAIFIFGFFRVFN